MGIDWIIERAKSFQRRRSRLIELNSQRLFNKEISVVYILKGRVTADGPPIVPGTPCMLQICGDALSIVLDGIRIIGEITSPPHDVFKEIQTIGCGISGGVIERVSDLSNDVNIRLN